MLNWFWNIAVISAITYSLIRFYTECVCCCHTQLWHRVSNRAVRCNLCYLCPLCSVLLFDDITCSICVSVPRECHRWVGFALYSKSCNGRELDFKRLIYTAYISSDTGYSYLCSTDILVIEIWYRVIRLFRERLSVILYRYNGFYLFSCIIKWSCWKRNRCIAHSYGSNNNYAAGCFYLNRLGFL